MKLLKEKIKILKNKYNGEKIVEEEFNDNKTALEQLDNILREKHNNDEKSEGRELYSEEKGKINEWDENISQQNENLIEVRKVVKELREEAEKARKTNEEIHQGTKILAIKIYHTHVKVKGQTERLTDLVNKIRSSDKICCDIILILIL